MGHSCSRHPSGNLCTEPGQWLFCVGSSSPQHVQLDGGKGGMGIVVTFGAIYAHSLGQSPHSL